MNSIHTAQRGLSLVELMIGLAIGLLIVAAATTLLAGQVQQLRQVGIEQRLMQELRSATDVLTRDLRRAGYWGAAASGIRLSAASAVPANPYAAIATISTNATTTGLNFSYSRDTMENQVLDTNEQFGLRLRSGGIDLQLGAGNWQALTDTTLVTVTELRITPRTELMSLRSLCRGACSSTDPTCAPTLQVRSLSLVITARAVADARVQRSLQSTVRVRNDAIDGACPV